MNLSHTYQTLPTELYKKCEPSEIPNQTLVIFNEALANSLGVSKSLIQPSTTDSSNNPNATITDKEWHISPIAQAYAGHQFGNLNILGDGRAHLLGELTVNNQLLDIQLKGSGRTPYSRGGDGKATLAPMLREYVISEAMHALGVPSSRSLAVVTTGESIYRKQREQGAILTRVAGSHLRVGTFVYASMLSHEQGNTEVLSKLVEYAVDRHYKLDKINPDNTATDVNVSADTVNSLPEKALWLLQNVMQNQAELIAHFRRVGFVHGVLNTDNVTISGETIDYGPCAFIDSYHENRVFSSIDRQGRYAFGNQMPIMWWNMARFAESLVPIIKQTNESEAEVVGRVTEVINCFGEMYQTAWSRMLCAKIGLMTNDANFTFAKTLLPLMQERELDYTNTFVALTNFVEVFVNDTDFKVTTLKAIDFKNSNLPTDDAFLDWLMAWQKKLVTEEKTDSIALMQQNNPRVIPRNHLVEQALTDASNNDMDSFDSLLAVLQTPYQNSTAIDERFTQPPSSEWAAGYQTFCGT